MSFVRELTGLVREARRELRCRRRARDDARRRADFAATRATSELFDRVDAITEQLAAARGSTAAPLTTSDPARPAAAGGDLEAMLAASAAEATANIERMTAELGPLPPIGTPTAAGIVERPRATGYCRRCGSGGDAGSACPCPDSPDPDQNGPRAAVAGG